jgi:hypothetical protein
MTSTADHDLGDGGEEVMIGADAQFMTDRIAGALPAPAVTEVLRYGNGMYSTEGRRPRGCG